MIERVGTVSLFVNDQDRAKTSIPASSALNYARMHLCIRGLRTVGFLSLQKAQTPKSRCIYLMKIGNTFAKPSVNPRQ